MGRDFKVWIGPRQREKFLETALRLRGIYPSVENENGAYCPVSMTGVPEPIKSVLASRRATLFDKILEPAGISNYDPATGPMSPDLNPRATFPEVYGVDARRVAENRFLVGTVIYPSFGFGTEAEMGLSLNRISVMLFDKSIRTARMWPPCAIFLGYDNLEEQSARFSQVFSFLKQYTPGIGIRYGQPILLGFEGERRAIDLAKTVYGEFPDLAYTHNPSNPLPLAELKNPEIFPESRPGASIKMELA